MSELTTAIRTLRERTGAGIMDCRRALASTGGDVDGAAVILKEQGLLQARKRQERETNEGRVFLKADGGKAVLLRLACETDFVARNGVFTALGGECVSLVFDGPAGPDELASLIQEAAGRIRENIALAGLRTLAAGAGERLFAYLHGEGRIGAVVRLAGSDPAAWESPEVLHLANSLALHVAAFGPLYVSRDSVDPRYLRDKEAECLADAVALGKPGGMVEGIARGKLDKHLSRVCLMDQGFIHEESATVGEVIRRLAGNGGPAPRVTGFLYERVGS
jgi:elongation factor Ts